MSDASLVEFWFLLKGTENRHWKVSREMSSSLTFKKEKTPRLERLIFPKDRTLSYFPFVCKYLFVHSFGYWLRVQALGLHRLDVSGDLATYCVIFGKLLNLSKAQ